MPLDVQQAMEKGRLLQATRRHRDITKLDLIGADEEGESWPLWCDVNSFGELGPGVPLYFHFVKHIISRLVATACLYILVIIYYWRSSSITLTEFGQRPSTELRAPARGASIDEWALGLYIGCSIRGISRLWKDQVGVHSISMPRLLPFTAASRGPWRGHDHSCMGLELTMTAFDLHAEHDLSGVYIACGYHKSFPWFSHSKTGHVLYATENEAGQGVWQVAMSIRAAPRCWPGDTEEELDISSVKQPPLAQSWAHQDQFPHFVHWPDLNITMGHRGWECSRSTRKIRRQAGISLIRCYDVALNYSGSERSLIWSVLPKDSDILLVSAVCVLIFWFSLPCFRAQVKLGENEARERTVSADDYAVYVRRLPSSKLHKLDEVEIASFFERCLDARYMQYKPKWQRSIHSVVRVTFAFRLGKIFSLLNKERDTSQRLRRLFQIAADLRRELADMERRCDASICMRFRLRYLRLSLWRLKKEQHRVKSSLMRCVEAISTAYDHIRVAGAIVTFEHPAAARRALKVFNSSTLRIRLLGRISLLTLPEGFKRFVTGLWPSWVVRRVIAQDESDLEFQGCLLSVERPPEPSDIVWRYLGEPSWMICCFRLLGIVITMICLAILTFATYTLKRFGVQAKRDRDDDKLQSSSWRDIGLTLTISAAIVWADIAMRELICKGVVMEHHISWTSATAASMWKLTLAAIANSAIVILLVHTIVDEAGITCEKNWYLRGNLLEDVMLVTIAMTVSTPIIQIIPHWNLHQVVKRTILRLPTGIGHCIFNPWSSRMTQEELTELYSGAEYRLGYRYATIFRTLFVTLCYAPLAPMVVPIGVLGMSLQYWADKTCLVRLARRPPWQTVKLQRLARKMLPVILMPIPLFTLFLLRGTSPSHVWEWLRPCIHPATLFAAHYDTRYSRGAQSFVMYVCIVMPCVVALPTAFGRGGYECWRCVLRTPYVIGDCICGCFRRLHSPAPLPATASLSMESESTIDDPQESFEQELSYYSAQSFLPAMYHKCNPVYRALPDVLNPEVILQPEPTAQDVASDHCKDVSWETRQLRREEQKKKLDEMWESLQGGTRSAKGKRVTVGAIEKDSIPLQLALEKILGQTAHLLPGWNSSGEPPEVSRTNTGKKHMDLLCSALRRHQREEAEYLAGKEGNRRRASLELAKAQWVTRPGVASGAWASSGNTAARRRWLLVRHAFFSPSRDMLSLLQQLQAPLKAPLSKDAIDIEMAALRTNSRHVRIVEARSETEVWW